MKANVFRRRGFGWLGGLTVTGLMLIGCSEQSSSLEQAMSARSNVVECSCNADATKACDAKGVEEFVWVQQHKSYTPGETEMVPVSQVKTFEEMYPEMKCELPAGSEELTKQRSGATDGKVEIRESPYAPKRSKDLPEQYTTKSRNLPRCADIAKVARASKSLYDIQRCVDDHLTGTDPRSAWYGMSAAQKEAYRQRLIESDSKFIGGAVGSPKTYACQRQHKPFAPANSEMELGESMFMDDYGAFHFENTHWGRFGFCKKY